jgi:hypothetical protein
LKESKAISKYGFRDWLLVTYPHWQHMLQCLRKLRLATVDSTLKNEQATGWPKLQHVLQKIIFFLTNGTIKIDCDTDLLIWQNRGMRDVKVCEYAIEGLIIIYNTLSNQGVGFSLLGKNGTDICSKTAFKSLTSCHIHSLIKSDTHPLLVCKKMARVSVPFTEGHY